MKQNFIYNTTISSLNNNSVSSAKLQSLYEIILEAKLLLKDASEEDKEAYKQAFIDMCGEVYACDFSEIRA